MEALRGKIGQMFLVGCQAASLTSNEATIFAAYQFGGFILFKRNCSEAAGIARLCRALWQTATVPPPFIAIDQEGGRVHRLPAPFTHFPAAARIGAQPDLELARRLGFAVANELKLIGVNLNFAPVLDVVSDWTNPVIGDRAFGADPRRVIEIASAWITGLRQGGIIPCGKHFPGQGGTDKDSHFELPSVNKCWDDLNLIELPPFADACKHRIESLMTAHVLYPALDADFPASLSEPIVTGLLRHRLGYDGVVFSDDMAMKAISAHHDREEAALRAVLAGVDILLFCHDVEDAVAAFEALYIAAERDPLVRARVEHSHRRISALKRRYLKDFTGVAEDEIAAKLAAMNHQRLVAVHFGGA